MFQILVTNLLLPNHQFQQQKIADFNTLDFAELLASEIHCHLHYHGGCGGDNSIAALRLAL